MNAVTLSIGNELVTGHTVDTNAAWLASRLAEAGVSLRLHATVGDELSDIIAEVRRACSLGEVVIVSGGLGPTADDLTREALAQAAGVSLEIRAEWVERIRAFFSARARIMPEANIVQAKFPVGSNVLDNTCGTAPGIHMRIEEADVFAVPGVPREMQQMFDRSIRPLLVKKVGGRAVVTRLLHCYGAGESEIGERIASLMQRGRNPDVGTNVNQTLITVRITATASDREMARGTLITPALSREGNGSLTPVQEANRMIDETAAEVRRLLGPLVFGEDDDTLASAVGRMLKSRGLTVTTAESCTGGLLAKQFTDVAGSSAYFVDGVVTYANAAKVRLLGVPEAMLAAQGAVSAPVAEAMARGAIARSETDFALSVTGIAGPDGGTAEKPVGLVFVGLAERGGKCEVTEHRLGATLVRSEIRERTCKIALNRLRMCMISGHS